MLDDNTSESLNVPVTSRKANLVPVNTSPTIFPVAPVTAWVIVSPLNRYAVVFNSTNKHFTSCDSILLTVLPFTEETCAWEPKPSVPTSDITREDPTEKLLTLSITDTESILPRSTSSIFASANSPLLEIPETLSLFAFTGISDWEISEL